ncbi:MAG: response regulator [Kofleriaceae bacterium]
MARDRSDESLDQVATRPVSIIRQVLVVDDTPANLVAFEAALEATGCGVVKAASGAEALGCLLEQDFSLVLLDVNMPGMDGFETARWIRSRERSAHVPIVFISAFNHDDEAVLRAYELGAVDFLFKPVYPQVLRAKVQFFIDLQNHQEEATALRFEREYEAKVRTFEAEAFAKERATSEELVRLNRTKDQFITSLAKEMREAKDQPERVGRLADDLNELARVGRGPLAVEQLDLRKIVAQGLQNARVEATLQLANDPVTIHGNQDRLVQAVANVLLTAMRSHADKIHVACIAKDRTALVIVEDNGAGISPELLPDIFDNHSLGIGLALAHRIVMRHKGTLSASSAGANQGTTFVVQLPIVS